MRYIFILLILTVSVGCDQGRFWKLAGQIFAAEEVAADTPSFKVIGVKDGDTIVILQDSTEQVVRLGHIDCPEKRQPFGTKAKQFVSDKCFGAFVTLQVNAKNKYDRNKRLIAEVILPNGDNLNKELVRNGLAWHFERYSDDDSYAMLEQKARRQKVGVWSEPNPIAPWEWRKRPKSKK